MFMMSRDCGPSGVQRYRDIESRSLGIVSVTAAFISHSPDRSHFGTYPICPIPGETTHARFSETDILSLFVLVNLNLLISASLS